MLALCVLEPAPPATLVPSLPFLTPLCALIIAVPLRYGHIASRWINLNRVRDCAPTFQRGEGGEGAGAEC